MVTGVQVCDDWQPLKQSHPTLAGHRGLFHGSSSRAQGSTLGRRPHEQGAVVVFEPSGKSDPKLFQEAIQLAHVVKYADQRLTAASGAMETGTNTLLEIKPPVEGLAVSAPAWPRRIQMDAFGCCGGAPCV